ncbi:unnamed protein product [Brachionus calyciflorus]|uniref:LNR domain-containing protein n=1 Tax=Brachionus calyciflorus TaxID=104777 RepID=A0A814DNU0_9BILA|nr:unnamed protein product [Brachionus calyciflorus]
MRRCDKLTKNVHRKLLDFIQTRQGITLICLSILIVLVFVLQLSETILEYHFFQPKQFSNRQQIDIVYTWVNGSDPDHIRQIKKYKFSNTTVKFAQVQVKDFLESQNSSFCHYKFCIQTNNLIVISPKLTGVDKQHFLLKSKTLLDHFVYSNLTIDSSRNISVLHINHYDFNQNKTLLSQLDILFKLTLLNQDYKFYIGFYTIDCDSSINCVHLDRTYLAKKYRERPVTRDYLSYNIGPLNKKIELPKIVKDNLIFESEYDYQPEMVFDPSSETKKEKSTKVNKKSNILLKVFKVKSKEAETYVQNNLNNYQNENLDLDFFQVYLVWDLGNPLSDDISTNRFQDNNELKYSLRSVEKYAPWIRNIYIVTNGQVPNWLNLSHPKIKLVNHSEIFMNKSHLPTFSSSAIETHLHRIKGLSDQFLYFNDDVLLGKRIYLDDFYTESKGFKFHLAWQLPGCNPNCPNSWIRDGYCDKACNTTECDFDGGDCDFSKSPNSARQTFLNQSHLITSDFFCSPGCSTSWLADKYCDHPCNNLNCAYDMGDCGVENFKNLYSIQIENLSKKLILQTPKNTNAFYLNFSQPIHLQKADYEENNLVRSISAVNKFKILIVLLMPSAISGDLKINLEYTLNNQTHLSDILINFGSFDLKIESTTKSLETRAPKISLNLTKMEPIKLNSRNFSDYSSQKSYNFKLFDDLHKNYVEFLNWSLNNNYLTQDGFKYKLGYFNSIMQELVNEYKDDADPVYYVYQFLFKYPLMEKSLLREYLNSENLDDRNLIKKFRKRKLLDTFADSLKNVNKLYNKIYGFAARKVPAHMPHYIDKQLMTQLQNKFEHEFIRTSSNRFRNESDMQYSFSYYYYVMSEYEPLNSSVLFDELDINKNGILDDLEIKLINLRLNPKKFDTYDFDMYKLKHEFEACLNECLNMSKVLTKNIYLNCSNLSNYLGEKFWTGLPSEEKSKRYRYNFETVGDQDTKFIMISGNYHDVEVKLNNLLREPTKFICLNDNIDYKLKNEANRLTILISNFYEMMFPVKSNFERDENLVENMEEKNNFMFILIGLILFLVLVLCVLKKLFAYSPNGKLRRFRREYKVSNALRKRMEKKTETSSISTSSENEFDSSSRVNCKNFEIESVFHQYVEPMVNKKLTKFCTDLTGITQEMVDGKSNIIDTLKLADEWIHKNQDLKIDENGFGKNFIFLLCGDWDLIKMLPSQCKYFNIEYPNYFKKWINIKKSFADLTSHFPKGMPVMLNALNLSLDGRHHSGIDDCRNIAKIAKEMANRGYVFKQTSKIK